MNDNARRKFPEELDPPSPDALEDLPPQVMEDEFEWCGSVLEEQVRKDNPDLYRSIKELADEVERSKREPRS